MRNVLDAFYSVWTATYKEAEAKATANVQAVYRAACAMKLMGTLA